MPVKGLYSLDFIEVDEKTSISFYNDSRIKET